MSRWLAYGFGLGLVAAVAAPGFGDPNDDSYPLSTYPMFARGRDKPWLNFAEGVDAQGRAVRLAPALVASGEVMQAAASVRQAVRGGPPALARLCTRIAERCAASDSTEDIVEVRIVGAQFDPIAYFERGPEPEARTVFFRCAVPRSP